ncbi:unnamed protein product, partial [Ectocarpus sp. 12 AP-2014]
MGSGLCGGGVRSCCWLALSFSVPPTHRDRKTPTITRSNRHQSDKRVDFGVRGVNRHTAEQSRDMVGGKISVMVALRVAMCILVHFSYACSALRRYIVCRCSSSRANMGRRRVLVKGGEPEIDAAVRIIRTPCFRFTRNIALTAH